MDDRLIEAQTRYEAAVFGGADDGLDIADRALDGVEADTALARGRIRHARYLSARAAGEEPGEDAVELALFERALALYEDLGDTRGAAEALFWVGCYHQVVRGGDMDTTQAMFTRSRDLAEAAGDDLTRSYALRHLAFIAWHAGRAADAHTAITESTRLRRELGFTAGVAANLIVEADLAADGGPGDPTTLLDEAATLATESGAHAVAGWVSEARMRLTQPPASTPHD